MNAKLLNATVAVLFGAAVITSATAVRAEDSGINEAEPWLNPQIADNSWNPKDYPSYQTNDFDANLAGVYRYPSSEYPLDGFEGGDGN